MTIRNIALLLAFLSCLPAAAMAQDEGAYVALNLGRGEMLHACSSPGIGAPCTDNKAYAYFATYGYQYTPMWGLEANYGKMGYTNSGGYSLLALGLTLEAVATLRMGDTFSVFARGGIAYADFRQNGFPPVPATLSGTSPAGGIGLQIDFNPKLAMRAQADYFGGYTVFPGASKIQLLTGSVGMMVKY